MLHSNKELPIRVWPWQKSIQKSLSLHELRMKCFFNFLWVTENAEGVNCRVVEWMKKRMSVHSSYTSYFSYNLLFSAILFGEGVNTQNHIGCIDPHCDVVRVIEDAYSNARFLCDQYYLASPELVLNCHNGRFGVLPWDQGNTITFCRSVIHQPSMYSTVK